MNPINNFFEKVFVTTIESHHERKSSLQSRIQNVSYEYFSEVDIPRTFMQYQYVKDFPDSFFNELNIDRQFASTWSKGQLGCFANVIKLYEHALKKKYANILVLEDDVIFKKNAFQIFEKAIKKLPADWDVLFLGYKQSRFHTRSYPGVKKLYYKTKGRNANDFIPNRYSEYLDIPPKIFVGAFAYALSNIGIKKILTYKNPIQEFGDTLFPMLVNEPRFKIFSIHPHIAKEADFVSSTVQNW